MGPWDCVVDFVERMLAETARRGEFDSIAGESRPIRINDDRPGWGTRGQIAGARATDEARSVLDGVEAELGSVWLLATESSVRARVAELNSRLSGSGLHEAALDAGETVMAWRRLACLRMIRQS